MKFNSADTEVIKLKREFWEGLFKVSLLFPERSFLWYIDALRCPSSIKVHPEFANYGSYLIEANSQVQLSRIPLAYVPHVRIIT